MAEVRIAGVAAPTSNAFIHEILETVASEVRALGGDAIVHKGNVADVDDGRTAFLIIPHEYYWFNPRPSAEHLRRTISLDVEHPGTNGFEVTSRVAQVLGAVFEISTDSVHELARRGISADLFTIGYSERWDMWGGDDRPRSLDLTYMAAADPERVQALAKLAPDLAGINANLLIPPYEQRIAPRPDFLMGETKWRFLADTNVILNLHREAKTALELIRIIEAMSNGCVVLTEPSTGLGGIEPGHHILVAPRDSIGHEAHRVLAEPELIRSVRHNAYDYCKRELSMRSSAERLMAVAEEVVRRAQTAGPPPLFNMPDWPERRPAHVPVLAQWVPEPYSLPAPGATLPPQVRHSISEHNEQRRERMALHDIHVGAGTPGAMVDALVTRTAASGSLEATLGRLAAQRTPVNVHVAGIGTAMEPDLEVAGYLTCTAETSIGAARNELIDRSTAPYLLVLEAGDEVFDGTLEQMLACMESDPALDLVYTMAAYDEQTIVNLFHPEPARLEIHAYLTRGFLVRRSSVHKLGTFADDPAIEAYVDHEFWTRVASNAEATTRHLHRIGMRLHPTDPAKLQPYDPAVIRKLLATGGPSASPAPAVVPPVAVATRPRSRIDPSNLPTVSTLMGAYNYGDYIVEAIESCMGQDYPADRLELVIVDDGSTDNTAELVASAMDRHPGRIRFVQQQNAGATAATNRARREATGDLIALLDADDIWLPEKTMRQVEMMLQRPELGLTFTRMRLIDGDGKTTSRNYGHQEPIPENGFARLLWENVAVQSSLIIDAGLFDQIPPEAPYADWWLALVAADYKKVDYLRDELVLYRWHGANITGGATGLKGLREAQKGIGFQRWVLRHFPLGEFTEKLTPEDMDYVWSGLENQAQKGLSSLHSFFGELAIVTDADLADAASDAAEAERALADGDFQHACALLLRARAADPFSEELRARFVDAIETARRAPQLPDPLSGYHGFAVLAGAAYLLADDVRLRAYADAMADQDAALLIDASEMDADEAGRELGALVERCGLTGSPLLLIGIVGELKPSQRLRVTGNTDAVYGDAAASSIGRTLNGTVPRFAPDSLPALRELAGNQTPRHATPWTSHASR